MTDIVVRHSDNARSPSVGDFLRSLVRRASTWRIHALAEADLRRLTERELADLGLERGEIRAAVRGALSR